ncbi:MAG: type II toxin-antitoxin system HicB family antitoxin [Rhodospirillales bacterium]|nr:type II toxin-antitoxin system HicB family antitoxin [Rhodospirillales bacterium]
MAHAETISTHEYTFTAVFGPAEEGGHIVTVPALPGVITEGDTLEEAKARVVEAIECYQESQQKDGLPLPASEYHIAEPERVEQVTVSLKTV